jgi:hypothetical protein
METIAYALNTLRGGHNAKLTQFAIQLFFKQFSTVVDVDENEGA